MMNLAPHGRIKLNSNQVDKLKYYLFVSISPKTLRLKIIYKPDTSP